MVEVKELFESILPVYEAKARQVALDKYSLDELEKQVKFIEASTYLQQEGTLKERESKTLTMCQENKEYSDLVVKIHKLKTTIASGSVEADALEKRLKFYTYYVYGGGDNGHKKIYS